MINANKKSKIPGELYTKRKEIINWYDKNFPNDFDLYGEGWNKRYFSGNKIIRALNLINIPNWLTMYSAPKTYKGFIDDKLKATSKYKFCFTYENTCAENDYLSEKIFDCMIAGSVPIYLGCPNIEEIVPNQAFVDARKFATFEEIHNHLRSINKVQYGKILHCIREYINGNKLKIILLKLGQREI